MNHTTSLVRALAIAGATMTLAACASLHDVDNKWCPPEQPAPAPVATQETIKLEADALFRFDRSDTRDILPQGRAELATLANKLNASYARIDSITLEGHTDRLGPEAYNQRLSQARADTVMRYLRDLGINAPMTAVGKGESDPVSANCKGNTATPELIACLQPDRRVVVHIVGVRQ